MIVNLQLFLLSAYSGKMLGYNFAFNIFYSLQGKALSINLYTLSGSS